jgi:hypothetical protein
MFPMLLLGTNGIAILQLLRNNKSVIRVVVTCASSHPQQISF